MIFARARRLGAVLALLAAFSFELLAVARPALAAGRHASLVIDVNSGQTLHSLAADELRYPASLTKIMTLYLVFELLEQGKLTLASRVRISQRAASQAPSRLGLDPGDEITVGDIIRSLIVKSANDMAVAIAEHIGGSEERFAQMMTAKAHQLGMRSTMFRNASGLPDPAQVTTARDMATLALALMDHFPRYYPMFAARAFSYAGTVHRTHNTLLGSFEGTDGIKTGYTSASGFNLVASVRRNGRHVVGVYFGGQTAAVRNAHMKVLLTRGIARAATQRTRRVLVADSHRRHAVPVPKSKTAHSAPVVPAPVPAVRPPVARTIWSAPGAGQGPAEAPVTIAKVRPVTADVPSSPAPQGGTPVAIAKVRRVAILPRGRAPAAAPSAPHRPPAAAAPHVAMHPAPQSPHRPAPPATGAIGAQPSTLGAQAARLDHGQAPVLPATGAPPMTVAALPPAYHLKGSVQSAPSPAAAGTIGIQVGAYLSESEARRQLQAVQANSGALLAGRQPLAQTGQSGGRRVFRARFAGFDAPGAASACNELRRMRIDCLVTRLD